MNQEEAEHMRVLKTDTCLSLSERSMLTYEIGVNQEQHLHLRITANSSRGYYSAAWVAYSAIEPLLMQADTLSAATLSGLFKGGSVNTPGFLMAVLKHLGVIHAVAEKKHAHQYDDAGDFKNAVHALVEGPMSVIDSGVGTAQEVTAHESQGGSKRRGKNQVVSTQK